MRLVNDTPIEALRILFFILPRLRCGSRKTNHRVAFDETCNTRIDSFCMSNFFVKIISIHIITNKINS